MHTCLCMCVRVCVGVVAKHLAAWAGGGALKGLNWPLSAFVTLYPFCSSNAFSVPVHKWILAGPALGVVREVQMHQASR